jgi:hypothetical protein
LRRESLSEEVDPKYSGELMTPTMETAGRTWRRRPGFSL